MLTPYDPRTLVAVSPYGPDEIIGPDGEVVGKHGIIDATEPKGRLGDNIKVIEGKSYVVIPVAPEDEDSQARTLMRSRSVVKPDKVRWQIRDYDFENAPLYERYLSDEDLWKCIEDACDDYNETTPIFEFPFTPADFKYPRILQAGAAVIAMKITAMKELRGEMNFDDGGIQSTLYYKTPAYTAMVQQLSEKYEMDKKKSKRQLNMSRCYKGVY